jgi:hypothetical protein
MTSRDTRCAAQVESHLEEMLLLCQRSEEYNQFMLSKMTDAVAPAILGTSRENAFRCRPSCLCEPVTTHSRQS